MATPTGTISLNDVRNELKISGQIDMNNAAVRKLANKTSGTISLNDLKGKSNTVVGNITLKGNVSYRHSGSGTSSATYNMDTNILMISGTVTVTGSITNVSNWSSAPKSKIEILLNNSVVRTHEANNGSYTLTLPVSNTNSSSIKIRLTASEGKMNGSTVGSYPNATTTYNGERPA
ncbi:MAG: hypothetical protein ACRCX2_29660 [Paraclostridium sp.]